MKTYRDLLEHLQTLPPEQLDKDVTVFVLGVGEFYPLLDGNSFGVANPEVNDVLDAGHLYLIV